MAEDLTLYMHDGVRGLAEKIRLLLSETGLVRWGGVEGGGGVSFLLLLEKGEGCERVLVLYMIRMGGFRRGVGPNAIFYLSCMRHISTKHFMVV
jgi:hypothetical protein